MGKQIIVNSGIREKRAAILVDNVLEDMFFERDTYDRIAGNIYLGRVKDVLPGMQAAFIDIGIDRNAFLHISDLYPLLSKEQLKQWHNNKLGIQHVLQPGQQLMIQVVKEPIGTKGPKVTCKVTIPGRYYVLLPLEHRINISRKITNDNERDRLRELSRELIRNEYGVIIRTNALNRKKEDLNFDYQYLDHLWKTVKNKESAANAPALLYQNVGLIKQLVRDYLSSDIDKLVVDSEEEYKKIVEMVDKIAPALKKRIHLYERRRPIFTTYGVEKELDRILQRRVWLDSGGYIIFDKTEALVSIDVNTGKYTGKKNLQDTVFKTNLEAAREIARQLRLRDIGGIIIIDFIDMAVQENRNMVLKTFEEELSRDRTKTAMLGLTELGLVEMTRKKVREGFGELIQKECPYCQGTGLVMSESTMALKVIREIGNQIDRENFSAILIELHPRVAAVLIGSGGEKLKELEDKLSLDIYLRGNDELHIEDFHVIKKGSKEAMLNLALPVKLGNKYRVEIEEKQSNNSQDGIARIDGYIILINEAGSLVGEEVEVEIVDISRTFARAVVV